MNWDLSAMYSGSEDPKLTKDLKALQVAAANIELKHKGKLAKYNAKQLRSFFIDNDKFTDKLYRLDAFSELAVSRNSADQQALVLSQKLKLAIADLSSHFIFIDIELAKHPKLKELEKSKELAPFNIYIENILKFKKHLLKHDQEDIINKLSVTARDGWDKLGEQNFSKATQLFRGKLLTKEQLFNLVRSEDRQTRKDAANAYSELLNKNIDLNVHIYNMLLLNKFQEDKLRKYNYPEESRHLANGVTESSVDLMVELAKQNVGDVQRFYRIKRKLLKLKDLYYYDRLAEVSLKNAKVQKYNYSEAVEMVQQSFLGFDPEFASIFLDLVNSNRIDAEVRKGKRGGGFCMYMPKDIKPYILVNFFGSPRDIQTLAHEAGHAIHDTLATKKLPLSVAHPPLSLAEVSSIFGEMIMFESLLKKAKTREQKIVLLVERLDDILATIFRQIAYYIFEKKAHNQLREKGALTEVQLKEYWQEAQKATYGDSVKVDDDFGNWWSYISHFYSSPFYVYAYSMANLLVFAIYKKYKDGDPNFVEKYKSFLALGGTKTTSEAVQQFGFDLEDPNFWKQGFAVVTDLIDQLEALC